MARAGLGLGAQELADLAGVSYPSLNRFEVGASVKPETAGLIKAALVEAGAQFTARSQRVGVSVPR
ncbi:MAG: transcriptional regulator [Pseudomonadota bacterium]